MSLHIINPNFTSDLKNNLRQMNVIQQIERYKGDTKVIYYDNNTYDGFIKDKPIIRKMLETASTGLCLDDFIICSNSDCIPNKTLYGNLQELDPDIIYLLFRQDIESWDGSNDLPNFKYMMLNGVDGFIISMKKYLEIKNDIPEIVFGEPYWDNIFYDISQKHAEVKFLRGCLFHLDHLRNWSLENEDDTNYKWIKETDYQKEEILFDLGNPVISVMTCFYNPTPERIKATLQFINKLVIQSISFELVFVELYDQDIIFKHLENYLSKFCVPVKKIDMKIEDANKSLFQRECVYNKFYNKCSTKNILFIDSDVSTFDFLWLDKIIESLKTNDIVHCCSEVTDDKDPLYHYQSSFEKCIFGIDRGLDDNPGIGWAMKKSLFKKIEGFSNGMIFGGSDSCFFEEITKNKNLQNYNNSIRELKAYRDNIRELKIDPKLGYVEVDLIHFNHGKVNERKYYERHIITEFVANILHSSIEDYIEFGDLLRWKHPINVVRYIIENKSKINKYNSLKSIVDLSKEYDELYNNDGVCIPVFSCKEIDTNFFQYNWSCNLLRYNKGIPIKTNSMLGYDSLVCNRENESQKSLFGIPCNKHWFPIKIKENSYLSFFISKEKGDIKIEYQKNGNDHNRYIIDTIPSDRLDKYLFSSKIIQGESIMCIVFDSYCNFEISNIVIH